VTLDKVLSTEIKNVRIYLGNYYCIPAAINTMTLTCSIDTIIAGIHAPIIKTELGNLNNGENLGTISVDLEINAISPATVMI
jgi:hypothetical protein